MSEDQNNDSEALIKIYEDTTGIKSSLNSELIERKKLGAFFKNLLEKLHDEKKIFEQMTPRQFRLFLQDWTKLYFG